MREKYPDERRSGRTFGISWGFWVWLALFFVALIFTQTLRAKASHVFFVFVLLLPLAMLLYVWLARAGLSVYLLSDSATIEKGKDFTFSFRVINALPLPIPFLRAQMRLPDPDGVRVRERTVMLGVLPMSATPFGNTVRFRFRGTYEIGVRSIVVYDFFHMFAIRMDVEEYNVIYVLPRRLRLSTDAADAVSDQAVRMLRRPFSPDRLEVSDMRDYRAGDPLKSVHWNLSSKSETLVVREYNTGSCATTCVFCDMRAHYPTKAPEEPEVSPIEGEEETDIAGEAREKNPEAEAARLAKSAFYEDMNEYCADGVVELAIATVEEELREGRQVWLLWFDSREEAGVCAYFVRTEEDFESIYRQFATAPVVYDEKDVTELSVIPERFGDMRSIYVTGAMDAVSVSRFCAVSAHMSAGRETDIILYDPMERFANAHARRSYIEGCRLRLAERGYRLHEGWLPPVTPSGTDTKEKVH